ncbi:MAG: SDR family oxidoreductase [Bdellovibrionales bacterium]|nr:SDR family oxidoreductase [Bdellovibrionales bacterium]
MIFLTGATGFLGREVLGRMLVASPDETVLVLVRASKEQSAQQRVRTILNETFGESLAGKYSERVRVLEGDLSLENFGLGDSAIKDLSNDVNQIFHCAASTDLGQSLVDARAANVGGAQRVLRFARECSKSAETPCSLLHVSTAYVAGDTDQVVASSDLCLNRSFRNGYEQSKAEAEQLVRAASSDLKTCIVRPSMIVGDSITGATSAFNVIYIPARYIASGLFKVLPARANTPCDLVPVDYVADAVIALAESSQESGLCYHLCSGVGRESTLREIVDLVLKTFNEARRRGLSLLQAPQLISPDTFSHLYRGGFKNIEEQFSRGLRVLKEILHLLPYMAANPRFDMSLTNRTLEGLVTPAPLFKDYGPLVFNYCLQTNWGKREWTNPDNLQNWWMRSQFASVSA